MGSFAKQMKRKQEKKDNKGVTRSLRRADRADRQVQHAFIRQNVTDTAVRMVTAHDLTIIFFVAAHRCFGFAAKRLKKLAEKMASHMECIQRGFVTVQDIEAILQEEGHMVIEHKGLKKVSHTRAIKWKVTGEMSAAFLISLLDGWGYKKKRLERVYEEAASIAAQLSDKEITIDDLEELLTGETKYKTEAVA